MDLSNAIPWIVLIVATIVAVIVWSATRLHLLVEMPTKNRAITGETAKISFSKGIKGFPDLVSIKVEYNPARLVKLKITCITFTEIATLTVFNRPLFTSYSVQPRENPGDCQERDAKQDDITRFRLMLQLLNKIFVEKSKYKFAEVIYTYDANEPRITKLLKESHSIIA